MVWRPPDQIAGHCAQDRRRRGGQRPEQPLRIYRDGQRMSSEHEPVDKSREIVIRRHRTGRVIAERHEYQQRPVDNQKHGSCQQPS